MAEVGVTSNLAEGRPRIQPDLCKFEVHFLHPCDGRVKTCYGCGKGIKYENATSFSPLDIIAVSRMHRTYFDVKGKKEKDAGIGNVYFHLRPDCIKKSVPDFDPSELQFPKYVIQKLCREHKRHVQISMKRDYTFVPMSDP